MFTAKRLRAADIDRKPWQDMPPIDQEQGLIARAQMLSPPKCKMSTQGLTKIKSSPLAPDLDRIILV